MPIGVVLVDDIPEILTMLRAALRLRGGFTVLGQAMTGAGAVALAGTAKPDLVVLDMNLPDLAGREVLTQIRAQSPTTRIVIFSGMPEEDLGSVDPSTTLFVPKTAAIDQLVDLLVDLGRPPATVAEIDLPQVLDSVARARDFVATQLRAWRADLLLVDALIVTSELATNAIVHADPPCRLRLSLDGSTLRIDVRDGGRGTPEPRALGETGEGGRGLQLVSALAAAWGVQAVAGDGKLVWAELARST
ncbi:MAG: response regulator [Oryzihumus sp.]